MIVAIRKLLVVLLGLLWLTLAVQAQEDITLVYYQHEGGTPGELKEAEMSEICAAELGYNIEYVAVAGGNAEFLTEIRTLAAADEMPDIYWNSAPFVDEFIIDGLALNIQEYVDRDILPIADEYFSSFFSDARYPNKETDDMYSFPLNFVTTILYYNANLFAEAGLDYPAEGWTWEDFLAAAQALTVDKDGDGVTDQYGLWTRGRYAAIEPWVYQNNGNYFNADRTAFEPDAAAVEALEFLYALVNEYGVAPVPAELEGLSDRQIFGTGLAAMWVDGDFQMPSLVQENYEGLEFGIAPIPRGPQWEQDLAFAWSNLLTISADTEHPEEAWEFVKCITGPLRTGDLIAQGTPIYRATAESAEYLGSDFLTGRGETLLNWASNPNRTSFTPGWGEWRGYIDGAGLEGQLTAAFNGNLSMEEALNNVTPVADGVLGRFYQN